MCPGIFQQHVHCLPGTIEFLSENSNILNDMQLRHFLGGQICRLHAAYICGITVINSIYVQYNIVLVFAICKSSYNSLDKIAFIKIKKTCCTGCSEIVCPSSINKIYVPQLNLPPDDILTLQELVITFYEDR